MVTLMQRRRAMMVQASAPEPPYSWKPGGWMFKLDSTGELVNGPANGSVGEFVYVGSKDGITFCNSFLKSEFNQGGRYSLPYQFQYNLRIRYWVWNWTTRKVTYGPGWRNPVGSINTNAGSNHGNYFIETAVIVKPDPGFVLYSAGNPGGNSCGFTIG